MAFEITIPGPDQSLTITINSGVSVIFVGANGCGKTRLAVHIEDSLSLNAHRISAHRALSLNPMVAKISEQRALSGLKTGYTEGDAHIQYRSGQRWKSKGAVSLLNDFDFLIQALFADQSNKSLITHTRVRAGDLSPAEPTKLECLVDIWQRLLPHRELCISGDNIEVLVAGSDSRYAASDMSDGERAIFYMIGQVLVASENTLLIIDEPELHVHRSIMDKLWDELEAVRPDCAFLFITHDLEFAANRTALKFIIREYTPNRWSLSPVPEDSGFDEELATLILGSRRPVLFVEGNQNSLDFAIYRCSFPNFTVIPMGSCEEVIHSVVTMRRNDALTRITCSGIVDADDYSEDEIAYLGRLGIAVLPVSEIENMILLPEVSRAIAESQSYNENEIEQKLTALKDAVFASLDSQIAIEAVVARYCKRRIDRLLKKIDLDSAKSVADICKEYTQAVGVIDINQIAQHANDRVNNAIRTRDLPSLLAIYDNKGLMAVAAAHLTQSKLAAFEAWLTRVLRNNAGANLTAAIANYLPTIDPR